MELPFICMAVDQTSGHLVLSKGSLLCLLEADSGLLTIRDIADTVGGGDPFITDVQWHPRGGVLALATMSKMLLVMERTNKNWQMLRTVSAPKQITMLRYSPDGERLYFADRAGDIHVLQEDELHRAMGYASTVTDVWIDRNATHIYSSDRDGKIRRAFYAAPLVIKDYMLAHRGGVSSICMSDEHEIDHLMVSGGSDGHLCLWNVVQTPPTLVQTLHLGSASAVWVVRKILAINTEHKFVVMLANRPSLCVVQISNGRLALSQTIALRTESISPTTMVFHARSRNLYVSSGGEASSVQVFRYAGQFEPIHTPASLFDTPAVRTKIPDLLNWPGRLQSGSMKSDQLQS